MPLTVQSDIRWKVPSQKRKIFRILRFAGENASAGGWRTPNLPIAYPMGEHKNKFQPQNGFALLRLPRRPTVLAILSEPKVFHFAPFVMTTSPYPVARLWNAGTTLFFACVRESGAKARFVQ